MADHDEDVLRRSLDAVDRQRNRLLIGFGLVLAFLLYVLFRFVSSMHHGGQDHFEAIMSHYFILLIWITALALIVIIQIAVMTKRILRAIELASRK